MFKKIHFKGLNYKDLERLDPHDLKRDEMKSFYQTFDFLELIEKWPQIVGPKLSQVTSPLKLRQETLIVITKHSIYSQELSFLGEMIRGEIFKIFPHLSHIIKKLNFQTQESFFAQREELERTKLKPPTLHPQSPQYKILRAEAERLFSSIEDTELRALMISLHIQGRSS